ncbi:ATP-binding protein [Roseiterribacter gracilis]|uniref:histidine kinase n=1 Tax=Roseiterribacter gracilis TaxID=2812848 RepID=A0A8S8XFG7_9PROT|nr:hypothetical protein TMPK1_36310 [Rhodospirillales bacterium TMPK1]
MQFKLPRLRILPRSTAGWVLLALVVGLTFTQIISILAFQIKLADVLRRIQFQNVAARVETIDKIVRALPEDARPQVLALIEEPGFRLSLAPPGPGEREPDDERKADLKQKLEDVVQSSRRLNRDRERAIRDQLEQVLEVHQEALDRAREAEQEVRRAAREAQKAHMDAERRMRKAQGKNDKNDREEDAADALDDAVTQREAARIAADAARRAREDVTRAREQMRRLSDQLRRGVAGSAYGDPVEDVMLNAPQIPQPQVQVPNPGVVVESKRMIAPFFGPSTVRTQPQVPQVVPNVAPPSPPVPPAPMATPAPAPVSPAPAPAPVATAEPLAQPQPRAPRPMLADLFDHNIEAVKVHLPLSGGNALTVTINATADPAGETANLALFLIGIGLAITAIAAWSIQRLTRPLTLFSNAAERLGREIDAPPVPERGPSEVRQAAHAFNQMADRLRRFVRDRTTMLAAISHDLRTPITRAKLRAEFVEDEVQQKKLLADLDEMEAMIAATMSFARDDANQEPRQPTDLADMLRHIGDEMRETGKDVTVNVPAELMTDCRPQAVKRVVCNLVQNAATYGSRAIVTLTADDEQIEVRVEDDGPGIPPEDLERVFAPFVRLEESRNRATGGVGLGLSIARSIARGHGGDLVLANKEPHGLVARLLLPR